MESVEPLREFSDRDRVLVLGAGGWFGRSFLRLLPTDLHIMKIASSQREDLIEWDSALVRDFNPTIVANFAFRTRERVALDGEVAFRRDNMNLLERFAEASGRPSVRSVLTVSSGAALTEPTSPYGELKLLEEEIACDLATASRAVVIARSYSVTGPYVRRPRDYAFSDFILQARDGNIKIASDRLTYRRYVAVEDFLRVCATHALSSWSGCVESGGELVEMVELARAVAEVVNPSAEISRNQSEVDEETTYASDNGSWTSACIRIQHEPMSLAEQIHYTHRHLVSPG